MKVATNPLLVIKVFSDTIVNSTTAVSVDEISGRNTILAIEFMIRTKYQLA